MGAVLERQATLRSLQHQAAPLQALQYTGPTVSGCAGLACGDALQAGQFILAKRLHRRRSTPPE